MNLTPEQQAERDRLLTEYMDTYFENEGYSEYQLVEMFNGGVASERARSRKLVEALDFIKCAVVLEGNGITTVNVCVNTARKALTEYKAGGEQ